MGTYRKIKREVLRRRVGNKALSLAYKKINANPVKRKKKSLFRRAIDKLKRVFIR